MGRKYEFYDTFKKSCEFNNGVGECHKTRESYKCIDDTCELVKIPMGKKEILHDYYTQHGSGESVNCPFCHNDIPVNNLINHTRTHKNEPSMYKSIMTGSGSIYKFDCPLCHQSLYIKHMKEHLRQHLNNNVF